MKKTFVVLCLLLLLLPLPGLLGSGNGWLGNDEEAAARSGFRNEMTTLHAWLCRMIGMSGSDQVALGKGGTLYLRETLAAATGARDMPPDTLNRLARGLKNLDDSLREKGTYLIFLGVPDKASVDQEDLPWYAPAREDESALDRLLEQLRALGVTAVDARAMLPRDGYLRTDTHWSDESARLVYQALMEKLPAASWQDYADAEREETWIQGDLSALIYPGNIPREQTYRRVIPRSYRVEGLMRSAMDQRIHTQSDANELRVIMLRDSFANALFPYLANNIGDLYLIRAAIWQEAFWQPGTDAVILEIAERNLETLLESPEI